MLLLPVVFCFAQTVITPSDITRFTPESGLSQASVNACFQDSRGFLWFGTADGLNRFDGQNFTVFRHNSADSFSLSDNYIFAIHEDSEGNLWAGTQLGLNKLERSTGKFTRYKHNPNDTSTLAFNRITSIYIQSRDSLWVSTAAYFNLLNPDNGKAVRFTTAPSPWIFKLEKDSRGILWLATAKGIFTFKSSTQETTHLQLLLPDIHTSIRSFVVDEKETLWYISESGYLGSVHTPSGKQALIKIPLKVPGSVLNACYLHDDKIFIGSTAGELFVYQISSGKLASVYMGSILQEQPNLPNITSFFVDNSGLLWIGTDGGGVIRINFTPKKFKRFSPSVTGKDVFYGEFIRAVYEDAEGLLWVSVLNKGLVRYNRVTGDRKIFPLRTPSGSLLFITSIHRDKTDKFWLTAEQGVFVYSASKGTLKQIHHDFASDLTFISDSVIAVAATSSIVFMHTRTYKVLHFKNFPPDPENSGYGQSTKILYLPPEDIFITSLRMGILHYSLKDSSLQQYSTRPESKYRLSSNNSRFMLYNKKLYGGVIWTGTEDGLNILNLENNTVKVLNAQNGLANAVIYTMAADRKGNIWLTTNGGIARLNIADTTFTNFALRDGVQSPEFNTNAVFQNKEGIIYFGGINGLNYFHPDSIVLNNHIPRVKLTGFKVNDREYVSELAVPELTSLMLNYHQNTVSFRFASLEFTDPDRNLYTYKLEGIDEEWSAPRHSKEVRYTGLAPGEYTFHLLGSNNDGIWSADTLTMRISIVPPWWQTWWFRSFAGLAVIAAVFLTIQRIADKKIRQEMQRVEQEKKILQERSRIARDMHDDVGANLSRILFTGRILKNSIGDSSPESAKLSSILQITDETIQKLDQIVWSINPNKDNLANLIGYISEYTQAFLENSSVKCRISIPAELPQRAIHSESRIHLFLICKEVLNNALKHAAAHTIELILEINNDAFTIVLRDDGKGFHFDPAGGEGNGLQNMQDRAQAAGVNLIISSEPGSGTTVIIHVPYNNLTF